VRAVEGVDPDPQPLACGRRLCLEEGGDHRAGLGLGVVGDRVLEVEQDDVGRGGRGLLRLAVAVTGREQPGARADGFFVGGHRCSLIDRRSG